MASPIADLSYRNYDGPLEPPIYRWWAIARTSIQRTFKNKWFWIFTIGSGLWYVILMIIFYFVDSFAGSIGPRRSMSLDPADAAAQMYKQVHWNDQFMHAFSYGQIFYFLIALLIGAGTIANDTRANALLVYLSKPCTKLDYIIGKWVGIFIPMLISVAIPTMFFYGYCFMSYRKHGFLNDPWLIMKLVPVMLLLAAFHASLSVGISSMFKNGRVAGATYAGLYFLAYSITTGLGLLHGSLQEGGHQTMLVDKLFYFSIDGVLIGFAKNIIGTNGGAGAFPFPSAAALASPVTPVAAPPFVLPLTLFVIFCVGSLLIAWSRVRAVEVVS